MMRWTATLAIFALIGLAVLLPRTGIGRRGNETTVRAHVGDRAGRVGEPLADFALANLAGEIVQLADLRGQLVLLVFERSVDW